MKTKKEIKSKIEKRRADVSKERAKKFKRLKNLRIVNKKNGHVMDGMTERRINMMRSPKKVADRKEKLK